MAPLPRTVGPSTPVHLEFDRQSRDVALGLVQPLRCWNLLQAGRKGCSSHKPESELSAPDPPRWQRGSIADPGDKFDLIAFGGDSRKVAVVLPPRVPDCRRYAQLLSVELHARPKSGAHLRRLGAAGIMARPKRRSRFQERTYRTKAGHPVLEQKWKFPRADLYTTILLNSSIREDRPQLEMKLPAQSITF